LALPPESPTCFSDAHRSWSTIDLVFVSDTVEDLVTLCETDAGHGSDHRCINTVLNLEVPAATREARLQWRNTDWVVFGCLVERGWEALRLDARADAAATREDLDSVVHDMANVLSQAAQEAVPFSKPSPFAKRWWTPELTAQQRALQRL
ncbi:hypothetical protein OH77DRAFT_1376117, partial [Trametes cingulata]